MVKDPRVSTLDPEFDVNSEMPGDLTELRGGPALEGETDGISIIAVCGGSTACGAALT
jgi:hypothetical protein